MPKTYVEEMEAKKVRQLHAAEIRPSDYMYRPPAETTTPMQMQTAQIKKMTKNQEEKMSSFIDEMRQQFVQQQNANTVPQSLILRQTQMMDRQVSVLEEN